MKNPFLIGPTIYLRPPQEGDEVIIAQSENHPEPRSLLYYAIPSTLEEQKERMKQRAGDHHTIPLTICTINPDEPIGYTSFVRISWVGRMATYYIAIAEQEKWSRGYGKEVTRLMVEYAFRTLNLNRIQLHVSVENERAIRVYESVGFKKEGALREAMYYDDRYIDFYLMAILKKDFINNKK